MYKSPHSMPILTKVWYNAGLDYLLIPDEERRLELKKRKEVKAVVKSQTLILNQDSLPKKKTNTHTSSNVQDQIKQEKYASPRSSQEVKEQNEKYNQKVSLLPTPVIKEYEWREDWREMWKKIAKHPKPKVVWTYTGLYADMVANEEKDIQRQTLIRYLIAQLKRPYGTHAFVPYDKEKGKLWLAEDSSFYWSAVSHFGSRHLFVFGEQAADELLIRKGNEYTSSIFKGYNVFFLPDITKINEQGEQKALLGYLNEQLEHYSI